MDENQTAIPQSFIALFIPRGRTRPTASQSTIAARYDLCEDLAQTLTEPARTTLFALSITEELVLERIHQGLLADGSGVTPDESRWIITRLAELLEWQLPDLAHDAS